MQQETWEERLVRLRALNEKIKRQSEELSEMQRELHTQIEELETVRKAPPEPEPEIAPRQGSLYRVEPVACTDGR